MRNAKTNGQGRRKRMSEAEIRAAFDAAEDEFGEDKSTEFLLSITADRCGLSYEAVVDALVSFEEP